MSFVEGKYTVGNRSTYTFNGLNPDTDYLFIMHFENTGAGYDYFNGQVTGGTRVANYAPYQAQFCIYKITASTAGLSSNSGSYATYACVLRLE